MDGRRQSAWRKAARVAAVLAILAAGTIVVLVVLSRQPPGWYAASLRVDPDAANDADQKLAAVMSWAAAEQAGATRLRFAAGQGTATADASDDAGPITLEFTAAEINSFVHKWSAVSSSAGSDQWADPAVYLEKDRIILAGRPGGGSTVLSVSIGLAIDDQGRLNATVDHARVGRLPLPGSVLSGSMALAEAALQSQLSVWKSQATVDGDGIGNPAAGNVCLARLGIALLESAAGHPSPVDPVLMMPFDPAHAKREMPLRVEAITIDQQSIRVTLRAIGVAPEPALRPSP
jgi:hypothetical protein